MPRFALIIIRFILGVDVATGVLICSALAILADRHVSLDVVLTSIGFALIPDIDMLPYLVVRNRMPYKSHWLIGHYPLVMIPLYGWLGWHVGMRMGQPSFMLAVSVLAVTWHFVHDSVQPQGLHWLAPFSLKRYSLCRLPWVEVPESVWRPIMLSLGKKTATLGGEFEGRSEKLNIRNLLLLLVAVSSLYMSMSSK